MVGAKVRCAAVEGLLAERDRLLAERDRLGRSAGLGQQPAQVLVELGLQLGVMRHLRMGRDESRGDLHRAPIGGDGLADSPGLPVDLPQLVQRPEEIPHRTGAHRRLLGDPPKPDLQGALQGRLRLGKGVHFAQAHAEVGEEPGQGVLVDGHLGTPLDQVLLDRHGPPIGVQGLLMPTRVALGSGDRLVGHREVGGPLEGARVPRTEWRLDPPELFLVQGDHIGQAASSEVERCEVVTALECVGVVGAQLGLVQLERRLEECDRLRQPADAIVGDGQVVAAKERLGVIGAQPGVEQLERRLEECDRLGRPPVGRVGGGK